MKLSIGIRVLLLVAVLIFGFWGVLPFGLLLLSVTSPLLALLGSTAYFALVVSTCNWLSERFSEPDG